MSACLFCLHYTNKDGTSLRNLKWTIQVVAFTATYYTDNNDVDESGSRGTLCGVASNVKIACNCSGRQAIKMLHKHYKQEKKL